MQCYQWLTSVNCNCNIKANCPLNGNCLTSSCIYVGAISSNLPNYGEKIYAGVSEPAFKSRYGNHKTLFNVGKYENSSELSKEFWKLKDKGVTQHINWRIIKHCATCNPVAKRCMLCLSKRGNLLNKWDELVSKCRHLNKYMLINHDSQD